MADRESAGAIYITIDGDASPLLAKYQQAEAQSRAAGQRIAAGLGQGLGQASGIVDQFGRSVSSGIVAPMEEAAPAVDNATRSVRGLSQALHGTVPEVAAASGAIRVLEGNMPIRAVERFATNVLGLGPILQGAFPLVGAIALGEMVVHVAENFGKLSEEEKKTAEDTKRVSDEWESLAKQLEGGEVEKATLEIGRLAGLRIGSFFDESEAQRMRARLAALTEQATAARRAMAIDTGTASLSSNPLVAGAQAINPAVTINRYLANVDFKDQAAKAKTLNDEIGILTEKLKIYDQTTSKINADKQQKETADEAKKAAEESKRVLDERRTAFKDFYDNQLADLKAAHEVTRAEELKFRQSELADAKSQGPGFAPVATEVNRQVGTLSQEVDKGVGTTVSEGRKIQVEQAKALMKSLQETMIRGLEEASAEGQRTLEQDRRVLQEFASEAVKRGDEGIKSAGVKQQSTDELSKLQTQQQYSLQLVHNRQDELAYAVQIAAADERALSDRIAELEELKLYQALTGQVNEENQTDLQIEQAKAALLKQQVQDQTVIATRIQQQSLAGQVQSAVGKGPATLLDAGNQIAAQGITRAVDGIASALGRAAQGGEKLGKIFSDLGRSILGSVVQGIAKIGLQMAVTAVTGKALGSAVAVAEVTSAAAVGAANAAAATAAIPIIGPALAPAAAAATFAEIMAFAPLASYDKGGMIPEDQLAMVHKGEFVLTADQMSGRSALPSLPIGGSINSGGFATASQISNSSSQNQSNIFHLNGIRNIEDFARRLPDVLKSRAPNFSPATS